MKLKEVCFFPEIKDGFTKFSGDEKIKFTNYLRKGINIAFCPDAVEVFGEIVGDSSPCTDGVWQWPNFLAECVVRLNWVVSTDFAAHARDNGWQVPPVNLESIEL